jgi:hypothetical protein
MDPWSFFLFLFDGRMNPWSLVVRCMQWLNCVSRTAGRVGAGENKERKKEELIRWMDPDARPVSEPKRTVRTSGDGCFIYFFHAQHMKS